MCVVGEAETREAVGARAGGPLVGRKGVDSQV